MTVVPGPGVRTDINNPSAHQLGKYRLMARLGQGGMGTVYLALASGLGQFRKVLVVKELRQDLTRIQGFVSMFMDEAKLAARLDHPNVVQTFEAGEESGRYYLAMEYLDGQPLSALIDRLTGAHELPLRLHIQILCDVLNGLHYAHRLTDYDGSSLQIVHRDVSPQNVFVTYHGQVKVVDFGVAKAAGATAMTDPGVFKGKFAYAAPEQVLGRPIDARTDVFAVGIMLWQAIAGKRFSDQLATPQAFRARAAGTEPRIRAVVPKIETKLAEICDRALAVDPDNRYESADEFRGALQDWLVSTGARVEASDIGSLMRDSFAKERRALHLLIERAMKHSGASDAAIALPFLQQGDREVTAVADLSSLVDVSLERDEDKIRNGYAHSKITLLRPPQVEAQVQLENVDSRSWLQRHPWLIGAFALVGAGAAAGSYLALMPAQPVPQHLPVVVTPTTALPMPVLAPTPAPVVSNPVSAPAEPALAEPSAEPETPPIAAQAKPPVETPRPAAHPVARAEPPRRGRAPAAPAKAPEAPVSTPEPSKPAAASGDKPAPAVGAGQDLRVIRRADARIDIEDPYR